MNNHGNIVLEPLPGLPKSASSICDDAMNTTLERAAENHFGVRHALTVNSGASAILTALLASGVGEGSEVILGPLGWGQAMAAVILTGATPVIVDCDRFGGVCAASASAAITARTRAIVTVCPNGIADDVPALLSLTRRHGLRLINDASLASERVRGAGADIHCLSIGPSKLIAAGEGGLVLTDDEGLYERGLLISQHPLRAHRELLTADHFHAISELFLSLRMSPLNAAEGLRALQTSKWRLSQRKQSHAHLASALDRALAAHGITETEAAPTHRHGDFARLVRRIDAIPGGVPDGTLRQRLSEHALIGGLMCGREVLLADKLAQAASGWVSPIVAAALRRTRVPDALPGAVAYCCHTLSIDCTDQSGGVAASRQDGEDS